jgi:transcriptional regulator with XRE-family HTH domain
MPVIGHKIKRIREMRGLKQEYVAEQLGISQQTYSKLENDHIDISFSKIEQLATIFEMKPEDIVTFDSQNVFTNHGKITAQQFANVHNSYFPVELKQLYEDQIQLLKEKIAWLEKR